MTLLSHTSVGALGVLVGMALTLAVERCGPARPPPMKFGRCLEITPAGYRGEESKGPTAECAWRRRLWRCEIFSGIGLDRDRWYCDATRECGSLDCLEELPR